MKTVTSNGTISRSNNRKFRDVAMSKITQRELGLRLAVSSSYVMGLSTALYEPL